MKSTNGLTSTDITRIIKACGESGVRSLKYGNLELELGEIEPKFTTTPYYEEVDLNTLESSAKEDDNETDVLTDADLEELKITDPFKWEEITQGDSV